MLHKKNNAKEIAMFYRNMESIGKLLNAMNIQAKSIFKG
jgi:hypothetical protein